jgi:hypothetical protein
MVVRAMSAARITVLTGSGCRRLARRKAPSPLLIKHRSEQLEPQPKPL